MDTGMHTETPRLLASIEYTAREALGGVSRSTVYKLINEGELTKVNIGRRGFVTVASLNEYVARLSAKAMA